MTLFQSPDEIDQIIRNAGKDAVVSRECKHATYSVHRDGEISDMLTIKEYVTLNDGRRLPTLRQVRNFKRPYWVTKPPFRDHPDKIEFEDMSRLDMFRSTQIELRRDICFRLGQGNPSNPLKQLARSPYLYGLDPGPEVFMKQSYMNRWPDAFQPNRVTVIDAETDMFKEGFQPILWSSVNDEEIVLYYDRMWCLAHTNYEDAVREEFYAILDQWVGMIKNKLTNEKTGEYPSFIDDIYKLPLRFVQNEGSFGITQDCVNYLHFTQPDIVTGWNVFFDATVIRDTCIAAGRDPADLMSDPRVPYEYRGAAFIQGPQTKKMSSGREMRLDPQERWNVILNTASWKMQDAMQVYWQLRKAKGKETGGYGLDAILSRQLGCGKLKYPVEDSQVPANTPHWHMDMQKNYKVRYGVYNIIDSLGVWVLDKKNNDLSSQISSLAGPCDYSKFNSQPTINAIDMLFSVMKKRQKIICSTSDQMEDDFDSMVPSKEGMIVTFPSHNVEDTGLFLFEDMPEVRSTVHGACADADVETTYPTAEIVQNLSKETQMMEPCRVRGAGRETLRLAGINLTGGQVNAIEIVETVCKMPTLDEFLAAARRDLLGL